MPALEEKLMMRPFFCATITRPTALQISQHAFRLMSMTCCHWASE